MFILINGSFGIGKTTVAGLLGECLTASAIYDPERVGFVLRRLPAFLLGRKRQPDDYQDLPLWRSLIARGARRMHRRTDIVIVPMAFTNREYWEGLVTALAQDGVVHRFCLVAPLETVRNRLQERAQAEGTEIDAWAIRRSAECVEAHRDPVFGAPVDAERPPAAIVADIRKAAGI